MSIYVSNILFYIQAIAIIQYKLQSHSFINCRQIANTLFVYIKKKSNFTHECFASHPIYTKAAAHLV